MRVAFASNDGLHVDEHFGQATAFSIWEIDATSASSVARIDKLPGSSDDEDRILAKAKALEGCAIAYSIAIGGPAAAKLVARRIQPLKTNGPAPIAELVAKLQLTLRESAPPWLAKAMGIAPNRRFVTTPSAEEE